MLFQVIAWIESAPIMGLVRMESAFVMSDGQGRSVTKGTIEYLDVFQIARSMVPLIYQLDTVNVTDRGPGFFAT